MCYCGKSIGIRLYGSVRCACTVLERPEPVEVTVDPDYLEVTVGDTVQFRCRVSGRPEGVVEWSRDVGDLPINALTEDGLLRFEASSDDLQGRYVCRLRSDTGQTIASATARLVIRLGLAFF